MIDIHIHILQGLDDGAMDMPEALMMLARAQTAGITDVIATPHSWAVDNSKVIGKAKMSQNRHPVDVAGVAGAFEEETSGQRRQQAHSSGWARP